LKILSPELESHFQLRFFLDFNFAHHGGVCPQATPIKNLRDSAKSADINSRDLPPGIFFGSLCPR
jgi:hypothetical protein